MNVLSTITQAGFEPTRIHYGDLRELFFSSIQWLHHKSHEADKIEEPEGTEDKIRFNIMLQLLQNDYLRGIIEGRFSNCNQNGVEHNVVFRVREKTIEIKVKEFKRP